MEWPVFQSFRVDFLGGNLCFIDRILEATEGHQVFVGNRNSFCGRHVDAIPHIHERDVAVVIHFFFFC